MSAPDWAPAVISARERFDITSVLMAPDGSGPDLVATTDPAAPQSALTSDAAADLARLRRVAGDAYATISGRNPSHCLAEISFAVGGPAFVTFSRSSEAVSKPMARFTGLARVRMQPRDPFSYRARDGRADHRLPDQAGRSAALARGTRRARGTVVTRPAAV